MQEFRPTDEALTYLLSPEGAARYAEVADLCCGIGGDALALAAQVEGVHAVDLDPLRLRMAVANVSVYEPDAQVDARCVDATQVLLPARCALWADPSRRVAGKRVYALSAYRPSLPALLALAARAPGIGVKLSPGVD